MKTVTPHILFFLGAVVSMCGGAAATLQATYEIEWIRQFGTKENDHVCEISADGLAALRRLREQAAKELPKAQNELRKVLTFDQEAALVLMGYLD